MPEPDQVLAVLRLGRARVRRAWCQHDYTHVRPDGTPAYCALGAVRVPFYNIDAELEAKRVLRRALPWHPGWGDSVWRWNDEEGRTQDQVLALYDRAIALRKAQLAQGAT